MSSTNATQQEGSVASTSAPVSPSISPVPLRSAMKHPHPLPGSQAASPSTPPSPPHGPSNISYFPRQDTLPTPRSELALLPPPSIAAVGYTPKVSFDTFENPVASMFSFTLSVKSEGYARTRSTRVFLCAASPDESGREALDWSIDSLVQDGDELIVFRGVDTEELERDHDLLRDEARDLMKQIQAKSAEVDGHRKLSFVLEYIPGRVTDTLDRLIALYRPDSVVVGTRGRRVWQGMGMGMGMGSVSKYCLSHSPVPIIVVRPERKVKKTMEKRRANPKRGKHFDE